MPCKIIIKATIEGLKTSQCSEYFARKPLQNIELFWKMKNILEQAMTFDSIDRNNKNTKVSSRSSIGMQGMFKASRVHLSLMGGPNFHKLHIDPNKASKVVFKVVQHLCERGQHLQR